MGIDKAHRNLNASNYNTLMAAIALGPYTMHPEHWVEPTVHVHICSFKMYLNLHKEESNYVMNS